MRRQSVVLAVALLFLSAVPALGQATFDAQTAVQDHMNFGHLTSSFSHTTTTAANRLLLVSVQLNLNVDSTVMAATVTYGGNPLTRLAVASDPETRTEVWYLVAPPTGSNTVAMTSTSTQSARVIISAITYSNAFQGAPNAFTNTGQSTTASVTALTLADDTVVDFVSSPENVTLTPNGAQTQGYNISTGSNNQNLQGASSRRNASTPSTNMSWGVSPSKRWTMIAVSLGDIFPTVAHMLETSAEQDDKGKVQITWTTSFEAENLGFNVYRETSGGREKINQHLIAGGTLFSNRSELASGRGYRWKDKVKSGEVAQYYVEDVDIHGVRTLHGPITPHLTSEEIADAANTDTVADLGTNGGVFLSPRGVGAPKHPTTTATAAQLAQQWELASQPAVKLMVTEEGWYRVAKRDLLAAGFDPGTDEKRLALFSEGIEQPILVDDGGDKSFDSADTIEFYGIGIDTIATGARAYWLVRDKGAKTRIKNDKPKKGKSTANWTPLTVSRVERSIFFTALVANGERENFFGPLISNAGAAQELTVENLDRSGGAAALEVVLQGGIGGTHTVTISVNGNDAGTVTFGEVEQLVSTHTIPNAWLVEGTNTIALLEHGGDDNLSLIESMRLTYPHRLAADGDALKVAASGGTNVTVGGFSTGAVRAFDITDPGSPILIGVDVTSAGGAYSASATVPGSGSHTLLFLADTRTLAPAQIVPSRASAWNDLANGADLVILTARAFASAAEPLRVRREAEGLATAIIDVQDLYDEFNFGRRGAEALREFLIRARAWQTSPRYVLLVGDASIDPRNYLGLGTYDFVPTRLVPTVYLKTADDSWIADFAQNGLPAVAIGRIPARTLAEAERMIGRIVNRDTSGAWANSVAFVADRNDQDYNFEAMVASLEVLVPGGFTKSSVLVRNLPAATARAQIKSAFESLLITYVGHGTTDRWLAGTFTNTIANQLTNGAKLPVVAGMTCLNAYYHDLFSVSFAETLLLNPNGGAVAVWTSSAQTEGEPQMEMARAFLPSLLGGERLGDAILAAKAATGDLDVRRSWIRLGDPSMKLR